MLCGRSDEREAAAGVAPASAWFAVETTRQRNLPSFERRSAMRTTGKIIALGVGAAVALPPSWTAWRSAICALA